MKKKTMFYYLTCMATCLMLHITIVQAQPSCSQWDWCRHNVEIKNTSCCTVEIWCEELGCDGRDYFMGHLESGKVFYGNPSAYGAKFRIAYDGYYRHEFPSLDVNGYCNNYNFEYKGSNNVCSKPSIHTNGDQTICKGQSVEICANGADNYWWSNGKDKRCITVSPDNTKTYTVSGSKNGCEATSHVTVHVNDSFSLHTDDNKTVCVGESVEICANGADGYWWSTGDEKRCITVNPHETTTYQVVGGKNGCEATGHVKVIVNDKFSMPSSDDQTICKGQSVEICGNNADGYNWNTGEGSSCITVSPHQTTTYTLVGNKNGCKDTDHVTVHVNDSFSLHTDDDKTICAGQSVKICANGADGYWWSNGKEKRCITASPHQTTTYQAYGVKNGCEGSGQVTVHVNDSFNLHTSNDQTIHSGESVEICASGADGYWWSNGKENACIHVNPHETTTYNVKGIKDGCEGFGEVTVIVNQSNICSIEDIKLQESSICKHSAVIEWTPYSNAWYSLYLRVSGDKNWHKFDIDYSGVKLNNLWPCTTYDWAISVKCGNGKVSDICDVRSFTTSGHCGSRLPSQGAIEISQSVEETFDNISILPNPATSLVVINYNDLLVRQISIYNNLGQLIENVETDTTGRTIVEVENYSSGVYVVIANATDKLYKKLFVVK